jgi:hypothetical protein
MVVKIKRTYRTSVARLVARDYYVSDALDLRHSLHPGPSQQATIARLPGFKFGSLHKAEPLNSDLAQRTRVSMMD